MFKLIKSFGYAFKGLKYAAQTQLNFRIHMGGMVLAIVAGLFLHLASFEWLWICAAITLVLVTELLNTSIETLTDMVSPAYHEKAGHVKDIAAGAVVIAALFALTVACIIFIPPIIALF